MLNDFGPTDTLAKLPVYPIPNLTHVLRLTLLTLVWFSFCPPTGLGQTIDPEVARFVGEVAVGTEYNEGSRVTVKWSDPVKLSLYDADAKQTRITKECIDKINRALATTNMKIEVLEANDPDATLKVYFAPLANFQEIADKHDINYVQGNWGYFYLMWNDKYEIKRAVVMLASDRLRGQRLKHFALEEITQALGLAGDSSRFEESLFFENQSRRKTGTATELSELDTKLLRFFYNRVEPGMHAVELGILMAKQWQ